MKYIKLFTMLNAIVIVAMLFTGCTCEEHPYDDWEVPTFGDGKDTVSTVPTTESIKSRFEFGQELWVVEIEGGETWLGRYTFIGQKDKEFIEAIPYFTPYAEQLKEVLNENPCIYLIDINRVYEDRYEAMAVVAEANGETFEEYWGEQN